MKKITLFLIVLLSIKSNAQSPAITDVNNQLRQMFGGLAKPSNNKLFLYDMAAHVADDELFNFGSTKVVVQAEDWFKVYEEMYHTAYDTSSMMLPDDIFKKAVSYGLDTIPIGIMNYDYYTFKPNAINTNDYFDFDTINDVISDKYPRPTPYPFDERKMFVGGLLNPNCKFTNPVFRIDPEFILFDNFNASNFNNSSCLIKIDFGDGTGWHTFNPSIVSHYQAQYAPDEQGIEIKIAIYDIEGTAKCQSHARLSPTFPNPAPLPPELLTPPGLNVGWYYNCQNNNNIKGRTIIYLKGFDPMDQIGSMRRTIPEIYQQMMQQSEVVQLRNQGYDIMIVDWNSSTIDIRFNALYLVNFIQDLKQRRDPNDREQFVVIGESMGGLIGRYALTYMESNFYREANSAPFFQEETDWNNVLYLQQHPEIFTLNQNWLQRDDMHATRLFISLDAPHQGANVPLSLQKFYRHIMGIFGNTFGFFLKTVAQSLNFMLDAQATQQLLIYHIDTENGLGFYKNYDSRDEFRTLREQLRDLGNYPQFAKVVLMSNGSLAGENQLNFFRSNATTDVFRQPNDHILDAHASLNARILWFIKIPIFGGDLTLNTNPDGQGLIDKANLGFWRIKIKLKWFGIKFYAGYNSLLLKADYAEARPYCTSAGSYYLIAANSTFPQPNTIRGYDLANGYLLNLFSYQLGNDGQGCLIFNSHVGWNGFASVNADFGACSDGALFTFIPTASALDYGNVQTQPLNLNIQNLGVLNQMPDRVDVAIGIPRRLRTERRRSFNFEHLNFRNDFINNINNTRDTRDGTFTTYSSCFDVPFTPGVSLDPIRNPLNRVKRGFINLEIGDEQLYLDNNTLNWAADYRSEYEIYGNQRNPRYEYASQPFGSLPNMIEGTYSRDNPYEILGNGFARYFVDNTLTGTGLDDSRLRGNYTAIQGPLDNCCRNFAQARIKQSNILATTKNNTNNSILVYPNPSNGSLLKLQYNVLQKEKSTFQLFNMQGKMVLTKSVAVPANTTNVITSLDISSLNLQSGLYLIVQTTGSQTTTSKFIISK